MTWGTAGRGVNDEPYNTDICVQAFTAHLQTVKRYLDRHPKSTARTFIVYAWNEWGEGGIIEPSRTLGYACLDALTSVFGLRPRLER